MITDAAGARSRHRTFLANEMIGERHGASDNQYADQHDQSIFKEEAEANYCDG